MPGIGFSPDKMLQGRLFSYGDAQRYRLGVNHHLIPVNAPRCPVHSYHRDGAMRVDGNHGGTLGYDALAPARLEPRRERHPQRPREARARCSCCCPRSIQYFVSKTFSRLAWSRSSLVSA